MRLFLRFSIIFLLFALIVQPSFAATGYTDVNEDYKHALAIRALSDSGLMKGYADQTFKPDKTINRVEALKVLVEARFDRSTIEHALDEHRAKKHSYVNLPDVSINDWFGSYVELGFKKNIVRGYPDKTFKPAISINFAEGLKMILEAYGVNIAQQNFKPSKFLYVKRTDWFAPYFSYALANNLINPNKFYHPSQLLTRGEFAEMIYRLETAKAGQPSASAWGLGVSNEYTVTIPVLNLINQRVSFADPYNAEDALELLRRSPLGHYLATPDRGKKFVLYGHSSGYAWDKSPYKVVLRQINEVKEGNAIYINYHEKGYEYRIYKSEVIPEHLDSQIMANEEANEIAIYTCWPPDSTRYRYVVYGKPMNVERPKIVLNK